MNMLELAASQPLRALAPTEVLISQGSSGGNIFVLESGRLAVERDGVKIASVSTPGALLGEMSVLLGRSSSATVRAEAASKVRVIGNARDVLESDPKLTFAVASLVAGRLDATSAFLVDLTRQTSSKSEQGLLARILSAIHLPADGNYVPLTRQDLFGDPDSPQG